MKDNNQESFWYTSGYDMNVNLEDLIVNNTNSTITPFTNQTVAVKDWKLYVIIGASAGGGLIMITTLTISIICCKRKGIQKTQNSSNAFDLNEDTMKKLELSPDVERQNEN